MAAPHLRGSSNRALRQRLARIVGERLAQREAHARAAVRPLIDPTAPTVTAHRDAALPVPRDPRNTGTDAEVRWIGLDRLTVRDIALAAPHKHSLNASYAEFWKRAPGAGSSRRRAR